MHTGINKSIVAGVALLAVLSFTPAWGQQQSTNEAATASDNTQINQRDRSPSAVTADQQKENRSDRQMTQNIRHAIVKDKSLSSYAHNVKVIAQDGKVTLKGPVRSEEEKNMIVSKAAEIAGESNVTDQMSIASNRK